MTSDNLKVYISGPISSRPASENDGAFNEAALKLESMGFIPVSPWFGDEGLTWEGYMKRDIAMMMDCDMLLMLEGWDYSQGATIERNLGLQLRYPVLYENRLDQGDYDLHQWFRTDTGIACKNLTVDEYLETL